MFVRLFIVLLSVLCSFPFSYEAESIMIEDTRVYSFLKGQALGRFYRKGLGDVNFKNALKSGKTNDLVACVNACGNLLSNDIFNSPKKLERLISKLEVRNITSEMIMDTMLGALTNLNKVVKYGEAANEDDFPKIALFSPEFPKYGKWLEQCKALCETGDNYELSKYDECYTLERALYIMFAHTSFGWWERNDKFLYVRYMCGAIRTYMHIVEHVDVAPYPGQASYFAILSRCYEFYTNDTKKNR